MGMRGALPGAGSEPAAAAKAEAFAPLVANWGVYWGYGVLSLVIYALAGAISDRAAAARAEALARFLAYRGFCEPTLC